MEDLIIFRRQRATKGQWMSHELPRIKIEMPRGTFVVFKKVADLLKAGNRDAVMFAFNKKDKCAYIISDELSVKKYNVIINFTDYLINKWKKGALFSQMIKNSKAVNYPKTLTKFINNINFIIQDEKDVQTKTMKTVFLYQQMNQLK